MRKKLRKWIKRVFNLYDIADLTVGGNCGCCGAWVEHEIVLKAWPYSICSNCLKEERMINNRTIKYPCISFPDK